jgi:hypothetical protein
MKVVIIGNGPDCISKERGRQIDDFDCVVRFNKINILGFEKFVGTKFDDWWCGLQFLRPRKPDFNILNSIEGNGNYLKNIKNAFIRASKKRVTRKSGAGIRKSIKWLQDNNPETRIINVDCIGIVERSSITYEDLRVNYEKKPVATSGLLATMHYVHEGHDVYLCGFNHIKNEAGHYGDKFYGNSVHSIDGENLWFHSMINSGKIKII